MDPVKYGSTNSHYNARNPGQVTNNCKQCGNSWAPIFGAYREVSYKSLAKAWWSILIGLISSTLCGIGCHYAGVDPLYTLMWVILLAFPLGLFLGEKIYCKGAEVFMTIVLFSLLAAAAIAAAIGIVVFVFLSFTGRIRY